nr:S24 family peptidase [Shewanella putrefaciens]
MKCSKRSFIVRVEGESKSPDFKPGDLIYVDLEPQVENGLTLSFGAAEA